MKSLLIFLTAASLILASSARAQEAPATLKELEAIKIKAEIERAKAQIEKARAEAEKAKAEAEKARAEAEKAKAEARKARAALEPEAKPEAVEDPESQEGYHRHDGIFLRMTAGPGFGGFEGTGHAIVPMSTEVLDDPEQEGTLFGGSFSLGGALSDNWILHGTAWYCASTSRKREEVDQDFGTAVVGGGMSYYFVPSNFYFSASIGLAVTAIGMQRRSDPIYAQEYDRESVTATGAGAMLAVGKEWWVSANWALGVAIQLDFSYTEGDDLTVRQGSARALFSATFN
jgi:hypothetical protein